MGYEYNGLANAPKMAQRLVNLAQQYAAGVADLQEARDEATSALAAQIRAAHATADDRALVRDQIANERDRRLT